MSFVPYEKSSLYVFQKGCFLCNSKYKKVKVNKYCKNYNEIEIKKADINIKVLLFMILSNDGKYYLPTEIQEIIFKYLSEVKIKKYITGEISNLSEYSLNHIKKCKDCSTSIKNYFRKNVCCAYIYNELGFENNNYVINIKL